MNALVVAFENFRHSVRCLAWNEAGLKARPVLAQYGSLYGNSTSNSATTVAVRQLFLFADQNLSEVFKDAVAYWLRLCAIFKAGVDGLQQKGLSRDVEREHAEPGLRRVDARPCFQKKPGEC